MRRVQVTTGVGGRREFREPGTGTSSKRVRAAVLALVLGALGACGSPPTVLQARTEEGKPVRDLLVKRRPNVILFYPPDYCFSCGQVMSEWLELGRGKQVNLVVLLTQAPSGATRRSLEIRRIPIAGTVEGTNAQGTPEEYYVVDGVARIVARGPSDTGKNSPVLQAVRRRTQEDAERLAAGDSASTATR